MSLRERVLSGVLWTSAGTVLKSGFQLAISIVLARILSPTDYGLIAMVIAVHSIFLPLASLEIGNALIRHEGEMTPRWLGTAFWMSVGLGGLATLVFALLAPLLAELYARPELTLLGRVLALGFAVGGIWTVPQALLRREMRFRAVSQADVAGLIVSGVVTIALAMKGFGVWSLALQGLIHGCVYSLLLWTSARFRPVLEFDRVIARAIFRFGAFGSAADLVIMSAASASNVIAGRVLGASDFGMFMRALGLTQLVVSLVSGIAQSVILPALAHVQQEPARFRSVCLRATGLSALVLAPALAAFVAVPDVVILFLYGERWVQAAVPLRILALPFIAHGSLFAFTAIFPALARTDLAFRYHLISGACMLTGTVIGSAFGTTTAIALGQSAVLLAVLPRVAAAGQLVGMTIRDYLGAVRAPFFAGVATAIVVAAVHYALRDQTLAVIASSVIASGALSYGLLTLGLRIDAVQSLRQFVGR